MLNSDKVETGLWVFSMRSLCTDYRVLNHVSAALVELHGRAILSHEAIMNKLLFHCDYQGNLPQGATLDVQWFIQGMLI